MNKKVVAWLLIVIVMVTSVMGNVEMTYADITKNKYEIQDSKRGK